MKDTPKKVMVIGEPPKRIPSLFMALLAYTSLAEKNLKSLGVLSPESKPRIGEKTFYRSSTPYIKEIKIGRNEKCHCGSGKKYKKCCLKKETPNEIWQGEVG